MRKLFTAFAIITISVVFAQVGNSWQDKQDDASAKELKLLAGKWQTVRYSYKDTVVFRIGDGGVLVIEGNKGKDGDAAGGPDEIIIAVDPTKNPKTIDYTITGGPRKGGVRRGIYELKGNELKICFSAMVNGPRPKELSATTTDGQEIFTYNRIK